MWQENIFLKFERNLNDKKNYLIDENYIDTFNTLKESFLPVNLFSDTIKKYLALSDQRLYSNHIV